MIALFSSIGWQEMFLLFFIGLLLYGRNLPDAGRSLGRVVAQLKRSFQDFKDQIDRDGEIRDVKKAISDTAREVKNVAKVPRAMSNPAGALRDLTHEAMSAPVDEERTLFGRISGLLPASVTLKLAKKSIQDYSEAAGHDLSYRLDWRS